MQNAYYNPKGIWTHIKPDIGSYFFTFMPIYNIPAAIDYLNDGWMCDEYKKEDNFFKP